MSNRLYSNVLLTVVGIFRQQQKQQYLWTFIFKTKSISDTSSIRFTETNNINSNKEFGFYIELAE